MASLADTLWHEFAVETEEHLLAVEPILAQADPDHLDGSEIGQLFRSFHSVKGLARAMDMLGMEGVAHHAENLLGLVREGRTKLTPDLTELLLQSVDALKRMRASVVAARHDTPPDTALLARLVAAFGAFGGASSFGSEAPATLTTDDAGTDLHEDPEMLAIFVDMTKTRGPELCGALSTLAADREAATDAAETLTHAADVMGFEALAASLEALHEAVRSAPAELDPGTRQGLLGQLGGIRLQFELIGEITGLDAGAAEFAAALTARLGQDWTGLAAEIEEALERLRVDLDSEDPLTAEADAAEVARQARRLHAGLAAQSLPRMAEILLLVEDLFGRAATGELPVTDALLDATAEAVARLGGGPEGVLADCGEAEAAALVAQLRASFGEETTGGEADSRLVAAIHVPVELLSVLSGENLAALEAGVSEGLIPYRLLLHLESEPATAERLLGWLTGEARAITNRTVVTGSESWFEFLVLSPLAPPEFAAALSALDPGRVCVKRIRRLTADPGGEPVLDEAADAAPLPVEAPAAGGRAGAAANVIRVRSEAIDAFLDEIGEMRVGVGALTHALRGGTTAAATARSRLLLGRLPAEQRGIVTKMLQELGERDRRLLDAEERIAGMVSRVHQSALEFRVVPIDAVFNRFPRVVRDLARRQGKSVELSLEGRDVRIDKSMVDALADPLLHMVRNAVDHGIEPIEERRAAGKPERARLVLRAAQRGSEIAIEIRDDGRGLDRDAIQAKAIDRGLIPAARAATLPDAEIFQCIFAPGLSTAAAITETSGRGVGMDVVLTTVRRLSGDIAIRSERGNGAVFTLTLPVSAALQNALIVRVAGESLAIPERNVEAVAEIQRDAVRSVGKGRSILYRQAVLPLYDLGALLGLPGAGAGVGDGQLPVVIASNGRNAIGLEVAAIERRQELFLKDLHPLLARFPGIGGASILADGRAVLVLDGDELIQLASRGIDLPQAEASGAAS